MNRIVSLLCHIHCCFERDLKLRDVREIISAHKASAKDQIISAV